MLSYVLQIATLGLSLYAAYQTKKIQHGQNIIAITTNTRLKRSEQLKEFCQILLTNTNPELLDLGNNRYELLKNAITASEGISANFHRNFKPDKELIELSSTVVDLAKRYKNENDKTELEKKRELFRLKCDIYIAADWQRIKKETEGVNTSASEWFEYYGQLEQKFAEEFEKLQ